MNAKFHADKIQAFPPSARVLRAFIPPGELLELEVKLTSIEGHTATIAIESRRSKRPIGTARVTLVAV